MAINKMSEEGGTPSMGSWIQQREARIILLFPPLGVFFLSFRSGFRWHIPKSRSDKVTKIQNCFVPRYQTDAIRFPLHVGACCRPPCTCQLIGTSSCTSAGYIAVISRTDMAFPCSSPWRDIVGHRINRPGLVLRINHSTASRSNEILRHEDRQKPVPPNATVTPITA